MMHLTIGNKQDKLNRTVEHVADSICSAKLHVVASHGKHGVAMSALKKILSERQMTFRQTAIDTLETDCGAKVVFTGFRSAWNVIEDPSMTNLYIWNMTYSSKRLEHKDMMRLILSHGDFHEVFAEIDSSEVFDGHSDRIVKSNGGVFMIDADPIREDEVKGDFNLCIKCGKCIGFHNAVQKDEYSVYDSSEPLVSDRTERGRLVKTEAESVSCLYEIILGGFKKMLSNVDLYVNNSCPFYVEHFLHGQNQ